LDRGRRDGKGGGRGRGRVKCRRIELSFTPLKFLGLCGDEES